MAVVKAKGRLTCEIKLKVDGRMVRFPGVKDRSTSRLIETRINKLIVSKTCHEPAPQEVLAWVRDLPNRAPRLFKRLAEEGLVDPHLLGRRKLKDLLVGMIKEKPDFADAVKSHHRNGNTDEQARRKTLVLRRDLYHIKNQGYLQSMLAKKITTAHVIEVMADVTAILDGCEFVYWDDLNCERLKQWLHEQRESREDFGLSTTNHYINSIKSFTTWVQKQLKRHGEAHPFEDLKKFDTSEDVRRKRRAATTDEMEKIVAATSLVGTVKRLSPEDRAMLYRAALTLGPRAAKCASLTRESFVETDDGLTLIIEATATKNGKEAKLPVPDALANLLRPWLPKKMEGEHLWPGTWHDEAAEMLRKDLIAAGIEYETKAGVLDFHATRHTAITQGSRVMNVVDLKAFARHAKIETTMRYVHTQDQALRNGVEKLPSIGISNGTPTLFQTPSKKCDQKRDHAGVSETQVGSTSGNNRQSNGKSESG